MNPVFRELAANDQAIVWEMLMHAAHEHDLNVVQQQPFLARYAQDWGREGDCGIGAWVDSRAVGAAWLRHWADDERGFGYVSDTIPELAIAVIPAYQGLGIGTRLLNELLAIASGRVPAISLNVRADNPAVALYQRVGFAPIPGSETQNRTGGVSFNMLYSFE